MIAERQLTVETALALLGPHFLIINVVIPWVAQWVPALALNETETVAMPSFSSLRVYLIGNDLTDPGLWLYLGLLWLCFGIWGYFRREALRDWGQELIADSPGSTKCLLSDRSAARPSDMRATRPIKVIRGGCRRQSGARASGSPPERLSRSCGAS